MLLKSKQEQILWSLELKFDSFMYSLKMCGVVKQEHVYIRPSTYVASRITEKVIQFQEMTLRTY